MSPVPSPHQSHLLGHGTRKEKRMRKVDTFAPHNDGHQWRKYGEKKINNCNFPRYYYRCTPTEFQLQTASGKAVSICFDSSGAQEPAANASSPSSSAAPRGTPSENKNQTLRLSEAHSSWGPSVIEQKQKMANSMKQDAVESIRRKQTNQ